MSLRVLVVQYSRTRRTRTIAEALATSLRAEVELAVRRADLASGAAATRVASFSNGLLAGISRRPPDERRAEGDTMEVRPGNLAR